MLSVATKILCLSVLKVSVSMTSELKVHSISRLHANKFDREFYATGYTYPLPAQHGVPGWQRIVMMKYFLDDNGNYEEEAIWAYEGVVLPGGQLIVGRWWAPDDNVSQEKVYSGPFIFWNIDPSVPPDERGPEFTTGFDMSNAL